MSTDKRNILLAAEKSLCEKRQKTIISRDKHSKVEHRAYNPERKYDIGSMGIKTKMSSWRFRGNSLTEKPFLRFLPYNAILKSRLREL